MTVYRDTLHWSGTTPIFYPFTDLDLITEFNFLPNCERFPKNICNGCGMPTEDAYSSGHLVLSHFGTCKCSNVETNLSWTCLVSGLLSFEHPSVLLFLLGIDVYKAITWNKTIILIIWQSKWVTKLIRWRPYLLSSYLGSLLTWPLTTLVPTFLLRCMFLYPPAC